MHIEFIRIIFNNKYKIQIFKSAELTRTRWARPIRYEASCGPSDEYINARSFKFLYFFIFNITNFDIFYLEFKISDKINCR